MPGASKRLVIDTDVARAAGGEEAVHPTSKNCRDFLLALRETSHRLVLTPEISAEWKRHQPRFSRAWLVSMFAQRRVLRVEIETRLDLRQRIEDVTDVSKKQAVLKDSHLIEAALVTDRIVISKDEVVRAILKAACQNVGEIRIIVWVNPDRAEEAPIPWLRDGAPDERQRQLGYVEE
jgi:hypothetical protein